MCIRDRHRSPHMEHASVVRLWQLNFTRANSGSTESLNCFSQSKLARDLPFLCRVRVHSASLWQGQQREQRSLSRLPLVLYLLETAARDVRTAWSYTRSQHHTFPPEPPQLLRLCDRSREQCL